MIPLDLWNSEEMKKRRENATAKALKEKPEVRLAATEEGSRYYSVKDGTYLVQTYCDPDGQYFVECNCQAGSPPLDEATGLPSREAQPCYHAAAVLIHIAEEEKSDEGRD